MSLPTVLQFALVAFALTLGAEDTLAQRTEEQKLTASDMGAFDFFGQSVSVSGDTAVVGARGDKCAAGSFCGSAYVYRFDGKEWVEEAKLTASDAAQLDLFGQSVSVSGDTVVVGILGDECAAGGFCGSAYVYRFDGTEWVAEAKLTASDAAAFDYFGFSVSISGDTAVVLARDHDCAAGGFCGSAYVYRFDGIEWVEEAKLTASVVAQIDDFEWSVSVSEDTIVVGAVGDDCAAGGFCGSAYVYRFNGTEWVKEAKLTASDAEAGDQFGRSVSVSGDAAVVGAVGDDCAAGFDCGSAYVYRFNGTEWVKEAKLTASDAAAFDQFGSSVSVKGDTAVVGAVGDDCAAGGFCGSAYVYRFDGASWVEKAKLTASDAAAGDGFGDSVSVSGGTAVVGVWGDDCTAGMNCGSMYVFRCALMCGDGIVDPCEACDDGNVDETDFCLSTCELNPNPVPAVSEWGLIVMALLVITAGTLISARRRSAVRFSHR